MAKDFDLVVIGAGPGGYVCAIRAAQLGLKTAIVEKRKTLGGTCLNVGCIPSKALLDSSENYEQAQHKLSDHGIQVGSVKLDLKTLMARKDKIVSEVCDGVEFLMKKNKIERFHGFGKLSSANSVQVDLEGGGSETLNAKNIVIASGSVPIEIPGAEIDGEKIITSDHAINLQKVPKKMVIIGAGVIGLELGSVWKRLGSEVTIVEMMPSLFPTMDKQMASLAQRILEGQGLQFLFSHKVLKAEKKASGVSIEVENKDGKKEKLDADVLLVAVGRRPYVEGMNLEGVGVKLTERKRIQVDEHFKTSVSGIYSIGDAIDGPMLAHKAEEEGIALAEQIAGQAGHVNYKAIPWIVYTWPEIAWVGIGEEELKKQGVEYKVGKSFFKSNARAKAMNESDGQVKIIADKKTDKMLGAFIVGPRASDMIAEMAIAFEFGASSEDVARSVHAHPTLSEVVREAAMATDKWSIHG